MEAEFQSKLIYLAQAGFKSHRAAAFTIDGDGLHAACDDGQTTTIETLFDYERGQFQPRSVVPDALRQETLRLSSALGGRPDGLHVRGADSGAAGDVAVTFDFALTVRARESGLELLDEGGAVVAAWQQGSRSSWQRPDGTRLGSWLVVSRQGIPIVPLAAPAPTGPRSRLSPLAERLSPA